MRTVVWRRSAARGNSAADAVAGRGPHADLEANIDQAWNVLEQVGKWIAHAEGKASLTLASVGVGSGVLFSVVSSRHGPGAAAISAAVACAVLLLAAGLCAAACLWPRTGRSRGPASLLYFGDIAHSYPSSPAPYAAALRAALNRPDALAEDIANQIWANSHVATQKFRWANLGVAILMAGLLLLGLTCALLL